MLTTNDINEIRRLTQENYPKNKLNYPKPVTHHRVARFLLPFVKNLDHIKYSLETHQWYDGNKTIEHGPLIGILGTVFRCILVKLKELLRDEKKHGGMEQVDYLTLSSEDGEFMSHVISYLSYEMLTTTTIY